MTEDLDKLTDVELDELVAVEVMSLRELRISTPWEVTDPPEQRQVTVGLNASGDVKQVPPSATSTDATMKLLESMGEDITIYRRFGKNEPWEVCVVLYTEDCKRYMGRSKTLARAVSIVLILVARALKYEDAI